MKRYFFLLLGVVLLATPWFAVADELVEIRRQIETLQNDYEQRIQALEERLKKAEAVAADAHQQAEAAEAAASEIVMAPAPGRVQEKENTFNPAVTVVLRVVLTVTRGIRTITPCRAFSWAVRQAWRPRA